ncbi:MAG: flagellar motor protein [Pseudomonadales bacterium]|nr:flagellar motor protein [Pseudomonadales bacterium]
MDLLSLLGVCIAFAAVIYGNFLEGGTLDALLNPPAALVVFGGTLGAVILQTPWPVLRRGIALLAWLVAPPRVSHSDIIKHMLVLSQAARKKGLLGVEDQAHNEKDRFLKQGLLLVADGYEPERIRQRMEDELERSATQDARAASIFEHMGGYAPTIGIIGAVMGLIQVMGNLDQPELVGSGIATAFVATIYGVGFANLLLFPVAGRLREILHDYLIARNLLVEGVVAIAEGEHPQMLEARLRSLVR